METVSLDIHRFKSRKGASVLEGLALFIWSSVAQTAALPRHQEEEETDKTKQAQIEQTYEKHQDFLPQAR